MTEGKIMSCLQFNSIKKTLIIPQGAILLWSWRAHKKIKKIQKIHEVKKNNTTNTTPPNAIIETYFNHA